MTSLPAFICDACSHGLEPLSLTITADRIFWTDVHYDDLLYHRMDDSEHRAKIFIGRRPLGAVLAIDRQAQPDGKNLELAARENILHHWISYMVK